MAILNARNLSLEEVHRIFGYQKEYAESFNALLLLEDLTEVEQQELLQIQEDFDRYLSSGKVSEGQVKFLAIAPLMRLARFYRDPIEIRLEEDIADIKIEDEDTIITGRMDILAVNKAKTSKNKAYFLTLIIEAKNSQIDVLVGLPQLLTYINESLSSQESVWGLVTNGRSYQFVYIQHGNPPVYQILPELNLMEHARSVILLQVLKAICLL